MTMIFSTILVGILSGMGYVIWWLSAKIDAQALMIATLLKNERVLVQNQETLQKDFTRLFNELKAVQKEISRK